MMEFRTNELIEGSVGSSSKGNQRKWRTRDGQYYIKECFFYQGKYWRDDMVEVLASNYAKHCATSQFDVDVLHQESCTVDGRHAVCSPNFCSPTQVFISFKRLLDRSGMDMPDFLQSAPKDNFSLISSLYMALAGLNAYDYLLAMATLDAITGNEDRHYNNFGVIYDMEDQSYSLPPLFDFGLGLFEHDKRYEGIPYKECIQMMQCKPFALENDKLVAFLCKEHPDFLQAFLPQDICVSDFSFPSEKAESYFRNRNIKLGVSLR